MYMPDSKQFVSLHNISNITKIQLVYKLNRYQIFFSIVVGAHIAEIRAKSVKNRPANQKL